METYKQLLPDGTVINVPKLNPRMMNKIRESICKGFGHGVSLGALKEMGFLKK